MINDSFYIRIFSSKSNANLGYYTQKNMIFYWFRYSYRYTQNLTKNKKNNDRRKMQTSPDQNEQQVRNKFFYKDKRRKNSYRI